MTDNSQTNSNAVSQNQKQSKPTQKQSQLSKGNAPVEIIRDGNTKVSIFKNERENFTAYSMEAGRIYTDKGGQVHEAKSFSANEALKVARLLERGYDRIGEFKKQHQQSPQDKTKTPKLER